MSDIYDEFLMFEILEKGGFIEEGDQATRYRDSDLDVADKLREEFYRNEIESADLEREDLSEELKEKIKWIIEDVYSELEDEAREAKRAALPGLSALSNIRDTSKHLLYSASPGNMEARWAEDYYNGYFSKRKAQIEEALAQGKTAASTGQGGYNNEGGASYFVRPLQSCWSRVTLLC